LRVIVVFKIEASKTEGSNEYCQASLICTI